MQTLTFTQPWGKPGARGGAVTLLLTTVFIAGANAPAFIYWLLPTLLLEIYLVVALFRNQITSTITPESVTITVGPLPAAPPRLILQPEIAYAYGRTVIIKVEGREHGRTHHTGIRTIQNEAIDITGPLPDNHHAMARARSVARLLQIGHNNLGMVDNPPGNHHNKILWVRYFTLALLGGLPLLLLL